MNPAVDGNGITASEMYDLGEEFMEDYRSGVYDIACELCKGERVVTPSQVQVWEEDEDERWMLAVERGFE